MTARITPRILLVDDEPHILDGLRRMLRADFNADTATGPQAGLQRLAETGPYTVVVSDFQMPHMNGAAFLAAARRLSPDTSRILLTGQADLAGTAAVVNDGAILRLLLKPAGREELTEAIRAGVEQHRLVISERELLEHTLRGSVRALTEILALASPRIFARSERLRSLIVALVQAGGLPLTWQLELSAMLADIGAIAVPPDVLERAQLGEELDADEAEMVSGLPAVADQILARIPRLDDVRAAILSQQARYDGRSATDPRSGDDIPLGGRLLRLAGDFDSLEVRGFDPAVALAMLRDASGSHDPRLLDLLTAVISSRADREPRELPVAGLRPGMILACDILTNSGMKLVAKGHELNPALMVKIRNYAAMATGVDEPVLVFVPAGAAVSAHVR